MKIIIQNPCHEDWNEMMVVNNGRFCQSCQKTVMDFTEKTPAEIAEYFHKNRGKKTCGRFRSYQLEREYHFSQATPLWYPSSKIVSILLASAMLVGTNGCFLLENETTGKAKISHQEAPYKSIQEENYEQKRKEERKKLGADTLRIPVFAPKTKEDVIGGTNMYESDNLYIVGTIKDEDGNIIPNVEVFIPQLKASINSDEEGKYSFELPPNTRGSYQITAKKAGFLPFSAKLNESTFKNESDNQLDIVMKSAKKKKSERLAQKEDLTFDIEKYGNLILTGSVGVEEELQLEAQMLNPKSNLLINADKEGKYSFKVPSNSIRPCQIRSRK